jgi:hypothetical protein
LAFLNSFVFKKLAGYTASQQERVYATPGIQSATSVLETAEGLGLANYEQGRVM